MSEITASQEPKKWSLRYRVQSTQPMDKAKKYYMVASVGLGMHLSSIIANTPVGEDLRDEFPEPLDYFDHAGNLSGSWLGSTFATSIALNALGNRNISEKRGKRIAVGAGMIACSALNFLAETKLGLSINPFREEGTVADTVDIAYGLAGGALGALHATAGYDRRQEIFNS